MKDINKILSLLKLSVLVILENGGETYRAEDTVIRICNSFDIYDVDVLAFPTGAFITVNWNNIGYSVIKRIKKRSVNLSKLDVVNAVSRGLSAHSITLDEALEALTKLTISKPKNRSLLIIAAALSSGFFTLLFGGSIFDFVVSGICGALVQCIAILFKREDMFHFIISLAGGAITASIAVLATSIFGTGNISAIITGAIMPLLPGLAMTNAIRDTMRGDLVSGTARGTEALMLAISLAAGVGFILKAWVLLGGAGL